MNKNESQQLRQFSEMHKLKETIAKIYPPTRSLTETRRIRWGSSGDFVPDIQEWLEDEAFVPIGLFKTTPVKPRVTNTPDFYCYACYHPQERIEVVIYKGGGTGFEFLRYNADSTITIATTDLPMLTPVTTPDFYQRVGPETDPESLYTMDDYFSVTREMLASLRAEPIPECGCLELNPEEFLQRYENRHARLMKEVDQKIDAFLESTKPIGKRFSLLNFVPEFQVEAVLQSCIEDFEGEHKKLPFASDGKIASAFQLITFRHLELSEEFEIEPILNAVLDYFPKLFFEEWGQEYEVPEGCDVYEPNWFQPFVNTLMMGLLTERWNDVARLCSWLDTDTEFQYAGAFDQVEAEVVSVFKLVASSMRPKPMTGLEPLRKSIGKCRSKRPRLLLKIWDAIEAGDQREFEKAMRESLRHFSKTAFPKGAGWWYYVTNLQSVLCLVAMKKGLKFPKLPEELAARLITRQTLGLE